MLAQLSPAKQQAETQTPSQNLTSTYTSASWLNNLYTLCCMLHTHLSDNVGCPGSRPESSGMFGVVSMHVLTDSQE